MTRSTFQKDRADRRPDHVLRTAGRIFLERGYDGATVEAIARAAGVAKKTIYASFSDKAELFVRATKYIIQYRIVDIEPADPTITIEENLKRYAREVLDVACSEENLRLLALLHREGHRFPRLRDTIKENLEQGLVARFTAYIEKQRARGHLNTAKSQEAALMFNSLILGYVYQLLLLQSPPPSLQENADYVDTAVTLFLYGVEGFSSDGMKTHERSTPSHGDQIG